MDKLSILLMIMIVSTLAFAQNTDTELANQYYLDGDHEKALSMFEKVARKKDQIPFIHANYLALMISKGSYDRAEKYLVKTSRTFPQSIQYRIDIIYLFDLIDEQDKKSQQLEVLSSTYHANQYQLSQISQQLAAKELNNEALFFLQKARETSGNPRAYALEMAALYRKTDDKRSMIEEYLKYGLINNRNTSYVKNLFQMLLTEEGDFDMLSDMLVVKVQQYPDEVSYIELLIWLELQQQDFYGAFVQARALDRRTSKPGDESMRVAKIAANNKAWEDAIEIYDYIIRTYPKSYHLYKAKEQRLNAKKEILLSDYPIPKDQLIGLSNQYQQLFEETGANPQSYELLKDRAFLLAYHLGAKDQAIDILSSITSQRGVPQELRDESKILLGDIYLLIDEPWEASLLYGQVQKSNKYAQLGYQARLKNARLYYFTGDFALANSYLKILKRATTKKISNNAMDLGLLISNNTVLDSTDFAMKDFSKIELLHYQNKYDTAIQKLNEFIKKYPKHSLLDEAYWLQSDIFLKQSNYDQALIALEKINESYSDDILGDDAAFKIATLFEEKQKDLEKAKLLYRDFITKYPGSMYVSEARRRFRNLRGDFDMLN